MLFQVKYEMLRGTFAYWTDDGVLARASKPAGIAQDAVSIYWTDTAAGTVIRLAKYAWAGPVLSGSVRAVRISPRMRGWPL